MMRKNIAAGFGSLSLVFSSLTFATPVAAQDGGTEAATETAEVHIDPARLAAAEKTVEYLFPLGTYERMMTGTMDQMMNSVLGSVGGVTVGDMAGASGMADAGLSEDEKNQSISDMARQKDPHFDERMKIMISVMTEEMVALMTKMEPAIRTSLTNIYARKYTTPQLLEMNRFFASETGSAFARDYMMVFVDPEMMESMMSMVPEMMTAMPNIMKKVKEATAHLPPPPKSAEELEMEEALSRMKTEGGFEGNEVQDEPWLLSENWSAADRKRVNQLSNNSDAALGEYHEAIERAQQNAKARLKKDD